MNEGINKLIELRNAELRNDRNEFGYKHQSNCFRTIQGVKHMNFADLCYGDVENEEVIAQAKEQYKSVKIISRGDGLKAIFVA